ncbi:MAG: AraC family transcriptional regulator [Velocimicrobium sp.]
MLKVIIADDEEKVCQLIVHLIDWNAVGMEIVDIVNDGKSAYESICDKKPDVVITDIRMPTYDGIELISRTKKILPDTYFVIISGYSHFEYAKQAIKYGVENYLLKPLKKKELEATLNKILEKYNYIHKISSEKNELIERLQLSEEKNKKNLIQNLMDSGKLGIVEMGLDEMNKEYHCNFKDTYFVGLIIHPFILNSVVEQQIYDLLLKKVNQIIDTRLSPICQEVVTAVYKDEVVCVINIIEDTLFDVKKQLNKMRMEIINWKEIFENITVIIGMGQIKSSFIGLDESILEAQEAILNRMVLSNKTIIEYIEIPQNNEVDYVIDQETRNKIVSSFERIDIDSLTQLIMQQEQKCQMQNLSGKQVFSCYKDLVQVISFSKKNYMPETRFPEQSFFIEKFRNTISMEELFCWLREYVRVEFQRHIESRKNSSIVPIRIAKQFIAENYNTSISLEEVSGMIGFNPAYFSTLFKKETGKNFTEYITEIRVQNAKQIIVKTNMDISDVAVEVGYSDLKYFSKLFKKITGVSPSEYRKLYG